MTDVLAGDLMVVRFAPYSAEAMLRKAERDYQRLIDEGKRPVYAISVFAIVRLNETTTVNDLIIEICKTAPAGGKKCAITTERRLNEEGFRLERSEPPRHHHEVVLGQELRETDVKRLEGVLAPGIRRNPAWGQQ
ncbi:hypothetical protein PV569_13025 [Streptomyces scabiei]|uniref:hypothetical protein n=1 Tax=Streptomyces scabiei TaxID=1930 RepID=UPI0029A5EAB1|nr:hypothetical protein [Streptomyces scabiei]MDX3294629.1 hypothetical protein [Streptomyces scabiei]